MRIKNTTWKTDFCGCIISYDYDDDLPDIQRIEIAKEVKFACPHHQATKNDPAAHKMVLNTESSKKENARKEVRDALGLDKDPEYVFDDERNVIIKLPNDKKNEIARINSLVSKFEKVKVE